MTIKEDFIQKLGDKYRQYRLTNLIKTGKITQKNYDELSVDEMALLVSRKYGDVVSFFIKRMREVKPNFRFRNFENNIEKLKIKDKLYMPNDWYADYDGLDNVINLKRKHRFSSIYHELMHMLSFCRADDGTLFCGFRQNILFVLDIGRGLNEGYTELLTERYFFDQGIDCSYSILVRFSKDLEKIIGKDLMEALYFNADLYNLKEEIIKDTSEEEFMQFLSDMDWVYYNEYYNKSDFNFQERIKRIQRMGNFVYLTYLKKQKRLFKLGKISNEEYTTNINNTFYEINTVYFYPGYNSIWKCDKKKMRKELAEIGIFKKLMEKDDFSDNVCNVLERNQAKKEQFEILNNKQKLMKMIG